MLRSAPNSPVLEGLGADLALIRKLVKDDAKTLDMLDRETVSGPGGDHSNRDNVPIGVGEPARGNSRQYALRKLRKSAPELHARVLAGELSPHAAMLEAKAALPHGEFTPMVEQDLGWTRRTAALLMTIATHPVLSNGKHVSHLPASWGTLSDLARLPAEVCEAAIASGQIHAEMERSDVKRLTLAVAYVVSLNLHRRHLDESQRALVADRIASLGQGARTDIAQICAMSQSESAELLNVSRRSVQAARVVHSHGAPELVRAVEQGVASVSAAAEVAQLEPEVRGEEGPARAWAPGRKERNRRAPGSTEHGTRPLERCSLHEVAFGC